MHWMQTDLSPLAAFGMACQVQRFSSPQNFERSRRTPPPLLGPGTVAPEAVEPRPVAAVLSVLCIRTRTWTDLLAPSSTVSAFRAVARCGHLSSIQRSETVFFAR